MKTQEIFVIKRSDEIWGNLFFSTEESARHYIKMRVPANFKLKETQHNIFVSKQYGNIYKIVMLKSFEAEQLKIANEYNK
jgi:hypothetical protein